MLAGVVSARSLRAAKRYSMVISETHRVRSIGCLSFWHDANFFFFVIDERMRRNALCQKNIGADGGIRANHGVAAHDRGSGINANAVFDCRVTFFPAQRSAPLRASAQ